MLEGAAQMPQLAQKLGGKIVVGPLVVGATHETVALMEAQNVEAVQEFVLQSGLVQWNTVRVESARPLEEALKEIERVPPPLY